MSDQDENVPLTRLERERASLRPENMKLLNTPGVENLYSGDGILTVLVLLPIANLLRWATGRLRRTTPP